jgi:exosortase/archaeosortase family protein
MKISKITTSLLGRVVIFLGFFVLLSGINGPRIISSDILFRDGFAIYGGLGKAAIFGLIALVLLVRSKGFELKLRSWQPVQLAWFAAALGLCIAAWVNVSSLLAGERTVWSLLLAHGGLILSTVTGAIACMGPTNVKVLWRTYQRQLLQAFAISGLFYIFLLVIYALWMPLASVVLTGVHALLGLTNIATQVIPPNVLLTEKFGITVAQYCSGIESIALFTGLYVLIGLLDRSRLNARRYALVFPAALIILFGLNIVRVFGLVIAGYYINPEIAFSLFHTYAGMIFFILYSAVFWALAYKHIFNKKVLPAGKPKATL